MAEPTNSSNADEQTTNENGSPTVAPPRPPLTWWQSILVRATRAAIASLGGGVLTGWTANQVGVPDNAMLKAALIAAGGAFVWSALQNAGELLAGLDKTQPGLRG